LAYTILTDSQQQQNFYWELGLANKLVAVLLCETGLIIADIRKKIQESRKAERNYQKRPTTVNLLIYKKSKAETRRLMKKTRRETRKVFVGTITEKTCLGQNEADIRQA
jgi:hypothetical protein